MQSIKAQKDEIMWIEIGKSTDKNLQMIENLINKWIFSYTMHFE